MDRVKGKGKKTVYFHTRVTVNDHWGMWNSSWQCTVTYRSRNLSLTKSLINAETPPNIHKFQEKLSTFPLRDLPELRFVFKYTILSLSHEKIWSQHWNLYFIIFSPLWMNTFKVKECNWDVGFLHKCCLNYKQHRQQKKKRNSVSLSLSFQMSIHGV